MNVTRSPSHRVERIAVDDNTFDVHVDGALAFRVERMFTGQNDRRGDWALYTLEGKYLDRNQYSNDLLERVAYCHYCSHRL